MSLPRLTSLSNQSLSQTLERQRLVQLGQTVPASLTAGIVRNLAILRAGILEIEAGHAELESNGVKNLREQWDRIRRMLGPSGETVDSLPPPREESPPPLRLPTPPPKTSEASYHPYKDDPDLEEGPNDHEMLHGQQMMMEEQDNHLDRLSSSIRNQHDISIQIGSELDVHTGLLEELDTDLDETQTRLGNARKRLDKVARGAKDNASTVTIGVLILILLALIVVFKT